MKHLKLFFALFAMLALGVGNAWGAEKTYTFTSKSWGDSESAWTSNKDGGQLTSGRGVQISTTYSGAGATSKNEFNNVSKVVVVYSTNASKGAGTINVQIGSNAQKSYTVTTTGGTTDRNAELSFSPEESGKIKLTVNCTTNSIYIKSIKIETVEGGATPEPDPDPTPGTGGTGTINFNSNAVKINAASVTGNDDLGNTWTITTVGTTSYTANNAYYQVGSGNKPATSITFTTTLPQEGTVTDFSAKFGGFSSTAGTVTLKVDDTSVGIGSLNGTSDVVVENSSEATGKTLTVTVTGIAKGVKVYYISYTYTTSSGGGKPETPATELTDAQFAWSATSATVQMGADDNVFPTLTNDKNVAVTYTSSNEAVATIDTNGEVTLVKEGTTTISAYYEGGEIEGVTYAAKTVTYELTVNKAPEVATENVYVKVTSTEGITDGEYLIVYEAGNVAFDGSLETLDAVGNTLEVTINNNTIAGTTYVDAATFTINVTNGTILSASGKYIGKTANSNGLDVKTTAMTNTFAIDEDGNAVITGNTAALRYNKTADQKRFRYYKDGGGTQEKIALYKKASSHTLTYGTCTNGSVSADVADGATVLSGTTITLSNTPKTDYKLSAYDVYKTGDETTKVTVTNGKFIMPEFDVTISATFVPAKTLTSIEITSAATQTTFWQNETFNHNGLKVIAHFDGASDEDVTDKVTVTGSTATAGAAVEVTVSFTEGTTTKTTEYDITVKATANTTETAYDVATAREIIDKVSSANDIYVQGIVSKIVTAYNSTYGNITYDISADGLTTSVQLQAFRGKSFNGDPFTSADDVKVGDEVVVFGNLLKYNSTYELAENNKLISLNRNKAVAGLAYETKEYTAKVNEAFSTPVLANPNGLTVTYSSSDENLATVDATTGAVTILDKTGKVTITATFDGNAAYLPGTASYNITITDPNQLEATFVAATDLGNTTRGEGSIAKSPITFACSDGILGNGSEYRLYQDANITFAAENGYAITKVVITSTASGTSDYGPAKLSTEEGTYTYSGKEGTWVGEAQTVTFTATAQSRAKLITVYYKTDNRQDAGLVWSTENVSITLGDAFTAPTLSNPNGLTLTCTSDNENLATVTNAGVVTLKSGVTGKATITAKFDGNSNYKDATVTCTITVNPKTEIVVILAQYNGQWYALKNVEETTGKVLAALPVNYVGGKLYNVEEVDKATIEWQRAAVTDGIIFKNGENYIYGTAGSTDLKLSTTECAWTLDGTTYKVGNRTFIYRAQANGFKNYNATNTPGTDDYSNLPVVTAPVYAIGDAYSRSTTADKFGTICLPFGSTNFTGAEFFECVGKEEGKVYIASVTTLVAGTPYIFLASATEVAVYGDGTTAATPGNSNGLYGTFTDETLVAAGNYILLNNELRPSNGEAKVNANRAYLVMDDVPVGAPQQMPGRRYIGMSVQGENETTGFENITAPEGQVIKAIVNGQLVIIRGGEMYNVQGQKL